MALELTVVRRQAKDARGHSRDERRQPAVGSPRIHGELLKLGIDVRKLLRRLTKRPANDGHHIVGRNPGDPT
jgi:hypothetical protein